MKFNELIVSPPVGKFYLQRRTLGIERHCVEVSLLNFSVKTFHHVRMKPKGVRLLNNRSEVNFGWGKMILRHAPDNVAEWEDLVGRKMLLDQQGPSDKGWRANACQVSG